MNVIKVNVNFKNRTIYKQGVDLTSGDYNSTKLVFEFDRQDGIKVFEMKDPDGEIVLWSEIENNEITLVGKDEDGNNASLFKEAGKYIFEISLYDGESKLTSAFDYIPVKEEQVKDGDKIVTAYLPIFDNLINEVQDLINQTNNLDIDIENSVVTITKKDGTTKSENVKGDKGEKGDKPVKGIDYFTQSDIDSMVSQVTEDATSEFNNNVAEKTSEFNSNAELKTTEFNNNAESKTSSFDTNVANQTKTFNDNANDKLNSYNANDTAKIEAYNDNATSKMNEYNNNASAKVEEYNTNANNKLEEYNVNANQKIAEYDAHSEELDNKIIDTRNELERVKNDVLETGTDTDTFVHLEDSAMAEYQELSVDGVCEQETTSGKNLLNESLITTKTMSGITWKYENGKIKISGGATNTYSQSGRIKITLPAGTYTLSKFGTTNLKYNCWIYNSSGTLIANSKLNNPFTINENATLIELFVEGISSGESYNNEMNFMISTSGGEYEPYTGGQPSPSPDYPQEIKTIENSFNITSCNKNLFDKNDTSKILNASITTVNKQLNYTNSKFKSLFIKCSPNTTYTITKASTSRFIAGFTNVNIVNSSTTFPYSLTSCKDGSASTSLTLTSDSDSKCLVVFYYRQESDTLSEQEILDSIQIEEGTTATEYEQHLETQIEVNLPEGEFIGKIDDTYKDTLKVEYNEEDGQYHLNLYKRVYKNNSYNGESYNYYISTTARKDGNIECGELQTGQVVYYDGDETIIDLGIVDQLITYNEITNLFTDSDLLPQINAKYYRNFISTVRNLQVNEKALKQELVDINTRLSALETAQTSVTSESEVTE